MFKRKYTFQKMILFSILLYITEISKIVLFERSYAFFEHVNYVKQN